MRARRELSDRVDGCKRRGADGCDDRGDVAEPMSVRMRNSSSTGALRSSIPSMRASFSTDECACSEQTTTFRPVTWRAAMSAASVEVDAASSM